MKNIIIIVVIILFLFNCKHKEIPLNIQTNGQLTLIDSSELTENLITYLAAQNQGYYPIHYKGQSSDTIRLRKRRIPRYGYADKDYGDRFRSADSSRMTILVDTLFDLTHTAYYEHYPMDSYKIITDSVVNYKAYPVLVKNISDSLLFVGDCYEWDNIVRQVKTKKGIWKDIEVPGRFWCGMGCKSIVLEPNQIMIAKLLRYKGDTIVECRLKYTVWKNTIYSNMFYEHLNIKEIQDVL